MNKFPFECVGCGEGFREEPPKCPKCGTFRVAKTTKIFKGVDASIRSCRAQLEATSELVTVRDHRKGRFIVAQLRRAVECVDVAIQAVQVDGSPAATKKKVSKG